MKLPRPVRARLRSPRVAGKWRLVVRNAGMAPLEITMVRDAPTGIGAFSTSDPFGPEQMTLTFPALTLFDSLGRGELAWCRPGADLDLIWDGELPTGYPNGRFVWEGHFMSFDHSSAGALSIGVRGAMLQADDFLAKPEYPARPLTYEFAIARQLTDKPSLRLGKPRVEWPAWWPLRYQATKGTPVYLLPTGVKSGDRWSAMLTRQTGSWDPVLTSYIQQLLQGMYTDRGRFALDLAPGRNPVLRHRDFKTVPDETTLVLDAAAPGVEINLGQDWSQSLNTVFGQGTSLAGIAYSGQRVSPDGQSTSYEPLAALRQVHPSSDRNGWLQKSRMRKEVNLTMQQGLDYEDAKKVGASHLQRFADPGATGTITLDSDPMLNGVPLPRSLIQAGMSVYLPRVFGTGVMLHITKTSVDLTSGKASLTVDSKYRDALTVDEVRQRGRDGLSITRSIIGRQFQLPISDSLVPWDYGQGSGYLPSGPAFSSVRLFRGMPEETLFPWSEWTTRRPPKAAAWKSSYVRIGPASDNADRNWSSVSDKAGSRFGIPVRLGQAGTIRMIELAAYDRDGNVMAVPFHVGFYYSRGVNFSSTPILPKALEPTNAPYKAGQHYPFFENAWEVIKEDGTKPNAQTNDATQTSGLIRAYGTRYQKAGHWPGSSAAKDAPTGLLVDEATWTWDTTNLGPNVFDPYSATKNQVNPLAGMVYMLIYCDAQDSREVFFAGRMYRSEPGAQV